MSNKDQHEVLLLAIECLKAQFASHQNPGIAFYIARYYHLLSRLRQITTFEKTKYSNASKTWLLRYGANPNHPHNSQLDFHGADGLDEQNRLML